MRIQRKRVTDIVSKYNVEGITSNGWVHGNNACETQGFRLDKDNLVMYYVIFDYEDGKYSLAKRLTCSPQEPYFIFTNKGPADHMSIFQPANIYHLHNQILHST